MGEERGEGCEDKPWIPSSGEGVRKGKGTGKVSGFGDSTQPQLPQNLSPKPAKKVGPGSQHSEPGSEWWVGAMGGCGAHLLQGQ